jgi:hypothetical protein
MTPSLQRSLGLALFILLFLVYWFSIPDSFNTVYGNRQYFDSDGEFITRQYRQGKTFTHNDHLLYHILGKAASESFGDPVRGHKFLSSYFGALGVVLLCWIGLRELKDPVMVLLMALLVGGSSGWWFFSATIDTYIPCLTVSILALGLALAVRKQPNLLVCSALGLAMGLAFLLRTDSFLLVVLLVVFLGRARWSWKEFLATLGAGLAVSVVGYALLAHAFYGVPFSDMAQWAFGGMQRPEAEERIWGVAGNLTAGNLGLTLVNHLFYAVLVPGLTTTREAMPLTAYAKAGWIAVTLYVAVLGAALRFVVPHGIRSLRNKQFGEALPFAVIVLWFLGRVVFYCWWNPFDPFLFGVMSIPALWLTMTTGYTIMTTCRPPGVQMAYRVIFGLAVAAVWAHNFHFMVAPLGS